jgi:hypothetical protein
MKENNEIIRANLTEQIMLVESALLACHNNLNAASEPELIDYYIYKIKSEEAEHKYLLNKIKDLEN